MLHWLHFLDFLRNRLKPRLTKLPSLEHKYNKRFYVCYTAPSIHKIETFKFQIIDFSTSRHDLSRENSDAMVGFFLSPIITINLVNALWIAERITCPCQDPVEVDTDG